MHRHEQREVPNHTSSQLTSGGCPSGAPTARSRVLPDAPEFKRAFGDFSRASEKLLARRGEHPAPAINALTEAKEDEEDEETKKPPEGGSSISSKLRSDKDQITP